MFLQTQVIGNLGNDCVIKEVNGKQVINFSVAHTEKFKNSQGIATEKTIWLECGMWRNEAVAPYLKKGVLVQVIGTPSINAFTNKQGEPSASLRLNVISIKLLSAAKKQDDNAPAAATASNKPEFDALGNFPPANTGESIDDLPF